MLMDLTRAWRNKETETFIKITSVSSPGERPAERAGREEEKGKKSEPSAQGGRIRWRKVYGFTANPIKTK